MTCTGAVFELVEDAVEGDLPLKWSNIFIIVWLWAEEGVSFGVPTPSLLRTASLILALSKSQCFNEWVGVVNVRIEHADRVVRKFFKKLTLMLRTSEMKGF
jgi:hypothetical protein